MPRSGEMSTDGRQWHGTPCQRNVNSSSVQGVWLGPDEDVDWTWSADGTCIIGYTTRQRAGIPLKISPEPRGLEPSYPKPYIRKVRTDEADIDTQEQV